MIKAAKSSNWNANDENNITKVKESVVSFVVNEVITLSLHANIFVRINYINKNIRIIETVNLIQLVI